MELKIQPTLDVEVKEADKGIVSRKEYFRKKKFEEINQYFFAGHLVRRWRPKADLIYSPIISDESAVQYEYDFNREVQNCFIEDYAEEVYLRTPPPCFVVVGKFGKSVVSLCEKISEEYGSVLIQVDNVVGQVVKTKTQTGEFLDKVLRLGVSLTLNFVLALLSYVAHTAEARHRGYVLCGLPTSPYLYDLPVDQQISYIFSWDNKPTVFINVLSEDEDLVRERGNWKWKINKIENEVSISFSDGSSEEEDEEEEEEKEEEEEETEIPEEVSPSRQRLLLPRDEESKVWSELEAFDIKIKSLIDMIKVRLDPQYFITVDSRVKNGFEMVRSRLNLLQVWKVPVPFSLCPNKQKSKLLEKKLSFSDRDDESTEREEELTEEQTEILNVVDEPPRVAFPVLFSKQTISPKYRWELSHYNYMCPVALREGERVEGKSEFAVVFMKYIYFLRDRDSMMKFLKNPRPYVLPIRPKPRYRFIIIGHPLCGKTTLAKTLSNEFSIPIINLRTVLKNDLVRKKFVYREFCRQKAEAREIARLTCLAWQNWRKEEEQRIALIEQWISYIQSLLVQRIELFYTPPPPDIASDKETRVHSYSPLGSVDGFAPESEGGEGGGKDFFAEGPLEVRGVSLDVDPYDRERTPVQSHTSPSEKIIRAMKHDDYEFNENALEVEANLFFSSLWNGFTKEQKRNEDGKEDASKSEVRKEEEEEEEVGDEEVGVNWCSLLPPQSLSSFLLKKKKTYTTKENRKSFLILLEAASKAYWSPSNLKTEFVKWRLPCFMDIPLCEIFLENPLLLFKYSPEWLKERPPFPDPVDNLHPSVEEAGHKAFEKANVVTIHHDAEEPHKLLSHAIEKAERDGMRVTGEVWTPGGWIIDNIDLEPAMWKALAAENLLPDYVYILTDSDPEFIRIINQWCNITSQVDTLFKRTDSFIEASDHLSETSEEVQPAPEPTDKPADATESNVVQLLKKSSDFLKEGNKELDILFEAILNWVEPKNIYLSSFLDPFCHNVLQEIMENSDESSDDDGGITICRLSNLNFAIGRDSEYSNQHLPLGEELQIFTNKVINAFLQHLEKKRSSNRLESIVYKNDMQFFINLLSLPRKLQELRVLLESLNKSDIIREIDITDKTETEIFTGIKKDLDSLFIKKPRELESFEKTELLRDLKRESGEEYDEGEGGDTNEDLRIYGESGPFCIVNLYRNNLLLGKPEFALRYYGKLYLFWNEDAKNKFIEEPEKYAPYYSPIRCLPPLRIFVAGPIGCGKSTLSRAIATQCSVSHVEYINYLNYKLVPHLEPECSKFTALNSQKLLLSEGFNAEAKMAKKKFLKVPYEKRQFYLENPFNAEDEKYVLEETMGRSPLPTTYPDLTYRCIESIEEEEEEEEKEEKEKKEEDDDDENNKKKEKEREKKTKLMEVYKLAVGESSQPYISIKEVEFMLNEYIQNKADLGEYLMQKTLQNLWQSIPFDSEGFVLDGFPLRHFDVKHILDNTWIPDMVVEVLLPQEVALERNMKEKLEQWETKLKQEIVEEKLLEDTLANIHKILMSIRRDQLLNGKKSGSIQKVDRQRSSEIRSEEPGSQNNGKQKLQKTLSSRPSSAFTTSSTSQNPMQVDEILTREFPPLEFNPIFETYDAGKARLTEDFIFNYQRDMEEIQKFKSVFQDLEIPWYEMDGTKNPEENLVKLFIRLNKVKERENLRGEFAFPLDMETADRLLRQGYYFLSKFGRWCPVQIFRSKNPIHMFRPLKGRGKIIPIAYRNYIYFVGGANEMTHFIKNPLKYTFNEPRLPNVPLRIAVIGPPKSGKSSLSQRLGAMFDLKVVTMGSALRFAVEKMPGSTLKKSITDYLRRGCFLPLSLKVEALIACLNDPACVTQGFVFDGIPFDAAMTQSLAEKGKLPFVILSLVSDAYFAKTNREALDREKFRLPYKQRLDLGSKYKDWDETYKRFVQWNQDTYSNLYELNAKSNAVTIFYEAYDIIRKSFFAILYYVENCVTDRALPLEYLCVSQHEYELRKSAFHNNCPVCWADLMRLNCVSDMPPRSGLIQYLEHFYWVCPEHYESFLKAPKNYLPPNVMEFPKVLPKVLNRYIFETASLKIHGLERCPVTRTDLPNSLEWLGSWDFAVSYADRVYLCRNQEMMQRFLAQPWKYYFADTEFEAGYLIKSTAVEDLGPPTLSSLPPVGFLEQTVADLIHRGLQILGSARPLYPNMTPTCTGCIFLGLYLKVYNNKKRGLLEKEYLKFMMHSCQAYRYRAMPFKRSTKDENDFEPEPSDSNDTDSCSKSLPDYSDASMDSFWADFETQANKTIWSAKNLSPKSIKMKMDSNDQLTEIIEVPKLNVVLRFTSSVLRFCPLPPIPNCITYIYTCKPNLKLPAKFNVNSLFQSQVFPSRFAQLIASDTEKPNLTELHSAQTIRHHSDPNLWQGKRTLSDVSFTDEDTASADDKNKNANFMVRNFIPRFQLLDVMPSIEVPPIPEVVETEPLVFNPHYDYCYTLLMADFFQVSNFIRCFEWTHCNHMLEYASMLDKNLGLCNVRSQYLFAPKISHSVNMRRSVESVQEVIESSHWMYAREGQDPHRGTVQQPRFDKTSVAELVHSIISDHIEEVFSRVSSSSLSYDSYETQFVPGESEVSLKPVILVKEILPFPPLPWDVISRPYLSYLALRFVFEIPKLDDIAHERHVSLLDGIKEPYDHLRFVSYPPRWLKESFPPSESFASKSKISSMVPLCTYKRNYFLFDFFNLHWSSFLSCNFSWVVNPETISKEDVVDEPLVCEK